jgi:hypothetical protein
MKIEIRTRHDKERGLFSIMDIKKGEFLCILPIDYFKLDEKWYTTHFKNKWKINFRYGITCEIENRNKKNQFENFHNFINKKKYIQWCSKKINIVGVSDPKIVEDIFIGHMINDYTTMYLLNEYKYDLLSTRHSNVCVSPKLQMFDHKNGKRLGLKIKSTRDIKKNEELYLSYGIEYWKKYTKSDKFEYDLNLSTLVL